MNISQVDEHTATIDELITELRSMVSLRNKMCGAMWYNILNDDAYKIANKLYALEVDQKLIHEILNS